MLFAMTIKVVLAKLSDVAPKKGLFNKEKVNFLNYPFN